MDKVKLTTTTVNLPAMPTITWTTKCAVPSKTSPDPEKVRQVLAKLKALLCEEYGLTWEEITEKSREPKKVSARFLYYYFLHTIYKLSAKSLTKLLGHETHVAALWALKQVEDRLDSKDPAWDEFKEHYLIIESKLPDITL